MMSKLIVCCLLSVVFLFAPAVYAQDAAIEPLKSSEYKLEKDESGALYLDFNGAALINVLNALSEISEINFVAGKEIASREVNLTLDGVSLEQALDAISQGSNVTYAYLPKTNIIMFRASSDAVALPPLFTRVFKLFYLRASPIREINAGESSSGGGGLQLVSDSSNTNNSSRNDTVSVPIVKMVEKMLSERGSVSIDERSNSLVVTDTEDRLSRVAAVVAELDKPLDQVMINVLLLETFEDLSRELGVEWANTAAANGVLGTITGGNRPSKFPFNLGDSTFGLNEANGSFLNSDLASSAVPDTTLTTSGSKNFTTLNMQVKSLQTADKLRILAKPNILVMDNHPAIVKIVTNASIGDIQVVSGDTAGGAGSSSTQEERAEVGTILRVTPQINTQDQITMTIEPTFATVATSTIGGAGTGDTTVRAARSTVMVKSGATLVMGGLLFSEHQETERKVPLLGDLPLVGKAFTSQGKSIQDRELVLFLTPQIIRNPLSLEQSQLPTRHERFDDVRAEFWKYKKKTWYKNKVHGKPKPDDYDQYFKVRETVMDKAAEELQSQKEAAMKEEVAKTGQSTEIKWDIG